MPVAATQQSRDGADAAAPDDVSTDADAPPVTPRTEASGTRGWVFGVAGGVAALLLVGAPSEPIQRDSAL